MKQKAVIIEDEIQMRKNLASILRLEQFEAFGAGNGQAGLELIRQHLPDIVLCDITLPKMDGFQVLKQLRSSPAIALTPFIFLTAKGEKSDQRLGMTLGADDYLSKPLMPEDLMRAIHSVLQKHSTWSVQTKNKLDYKSNFIASVTHDLRSTLSVLLLNLDSLQFDQQSLAHDEPQEIIHEMRSQIKLMNRMIEDILTYGRLETGGMPIQRLPVDIADLTERSINDLIHIDGGEHHFLVTKENIPTDLWLDPLLTRQIISHLLANAVKYSSSGADISIHLQMHESCLVLQVTDHGIGIRPEDMDHIFQPAQPAADSGLQHATGYGLFIVKSYVDWLGGTIQVESVPRQGSTFTIRLPIETKSD